MSNPLSSSSFSPARFLQAVFLDDAAVEEVDGAIGVARVARVVRDHADRRAFAVQLAEQLHDGFAVLRVEVSGRLVRQQDRRGAGDGAGDRDALLLTARELRGQVLGAVRHADLLERRHHALLALGRLHAAIGERQLDVLVDVQVADQVEALEDEPDLAVAHARALGERQVRDFLAVQDVAPFGRRVEQPQDREQRRLAAARRAGNRDVLTALDLEVDAGQGMRLDLVGEEHLRDAVEVDERLRGRVHMAPLLAFQLHSIERIEL